MKSIKRENGMQTEKTIVLTISLLVSGREETTLRCLDSLHPLMESITSELILVDTGCSSTFLDQLRSYADRIIPFVWCDDFSMARNAGLSQARGEWFLYIDDDEWFEDTGAIETFFTSGEYKEYGYANYMQRNFFDPEYRVYTDNWVSRMIRLTDEVHFRSRIHEYLDPVYGKGKNIKAVANHTGYIYATEADRRKRYARNVPLLKEMMVEEPDQLRWSVQLVQEYYSVEEWNQLERFCRMVLQSENYREQPLMKRLAATFYAGLTEAVLEQQRPEESMDEARKALASDDCSPLGKAYLMLQEAVACAEKQEWNAAKRCVEKYFALEKELAADEEQYAIWQEALIVDSTYDSINKKKGYMIRLLCALVQENAEELRQSLQKLEWNQNVVYAYPRLMPVLLDVLMEHPEVSHVETIWRTIWGNQRLCDRMIEESRDDWKRKDRVTRGIMKENYHKQVAKILTRYYKPEILDDYALCLPDIAQRALGLIGEIERGTK